MIFFNSLVRSFVTVVRSSGLYVENKNEMSENCQVLIIANRLDLTTTLELYSGE